MRTLGGRGSKSRPGATLRGRHHVPFMEIEGEWRFAGPKWRTPPHDLENTGEFFG